MAGLAVFAIGTASAQIVRNFTPRYTSNGNGDITLIGNTIMTCNGNGQCSKGQQGTGGNVDDNDFTMVYVDVDGDPSTFSSSSATLSLPAGASVLWAGLYWGGDSNNGARNTCRLKTPVAGYANVTANQIDVNTTDYAAIADVTTQVRAGGNGTYTVANVYSNPNNTNIHGGWSLVIVYGLSSLPLRNLVVFDGYAHVNTGTNVTVNATGFVTPPAGVVNTRVGVVAFEGDLGLTGDQFLLNGTALSDAHNPANNFFNSSISLLGTTFTAKNPNYLDQLGFDADLVTANGILPNGATGATIQMTSNGDEYFPSAVTFATDLYAPVFSTTGFTKTVSDLNGAPARAGDVLEYTVTMTNSGQDHAVGCVMRDTLPANAAYVPGSLTVVSGPNAGAKTDAAGDDQMEYVAASRTVVARLGTGANGTTGGQMSIGVVSAVKFRVTITPPAPTGATVSNQGWLAFTAQQSGIAFTAKSDGDPATPAEQPTVVTTTGTVLSGTVFEDPNYGGGAGRTRAASSGVVRPGARVELYSNTGAWLAADTTDAAGAFDFAGWPAGAYTVRVVNATVTSSRSGAIAGLLPVQTFRVDASSGSAVAVTDRVGGETPSLADAAANTTAASLASLTTASTTAQSIAAVTLGTTDLGGLDFGYDFDTIVNVNDAGQGSLRQFLVNANALGNTGLAQSGQTAGVETSIFMVSDGAAHPGLRAGLANLLTGGVARITLASALPPWTAAATRLDGATQTTNVGNTNAVSLGSGGTVGVDALALATVAGPEVEIVDGAAIGLGLDLEAASEEVNAIAIRGFGNAPASSSDANILVGATANGVRITSCVLGTSATSFSDPGAAARSGGDQIRLIGGDNGLAQNCLIGYAVGTGVSIGSSSNGWQVTGCEIRGNAIGQGARDGIGIASSSGTTISGNLVADEDGCGIDFDPSSGTITVVDNTVTHCGRLGTPGTDQPGIRAGGPNDVIDRNVLASNYGAGVMVNASATNDVITRNAMSGNGTIATSGGGAASGEIGIDLLSATDNPSTGTAPFVTLNDAGDADGGANGLLNFPVLESASVAGGTLTITGWARPGSVIELFLSDGDASGFGEGATWVTTLTEGSAADLDASTSAYGGTINGLAQGGDNTNRFRFAVPAPPGVVSGVRLTATATIAGVGTSEFSGVVLVGGGVNVSGFAYADADHDANRDVAEGGTGTALFVKLVASGGSAATQVATADPATGAWTLASVGAGTWSLVLDTNANPADVTAGLPAGWLGTEAPTGVRAATVASVDLTNQNFGLWHGARADGVVFRDDGAGGSVANDGVAQAGETGVAAARVRLFAAACSGGECDSALTDGAGRWSLWVPFVATGAVARIGETNLPGWVSTGGSPGNSGGSYARASDVFTYLPVAGVVASGIGFGDVPPATLVAPGAQSVAPGGFVAYAHRFTAGTVGTVSFSATEAPSPAIAGWSLVLVRDLNCNGVADAGEPVVSGPLPVGAGQPICLVARHTAPPGAPTGASELATLSASFVYTGATPALSDTTRLADLTTITAQGLLITKSVNAASARPGDALTYTIQYTNLGNQPLSGIVIHDATPAWTTFASASCGTLGTGLTSCNVTTEPAPGASGALTWSLGGSLAPGASGSVTFAVTVQ